MRNFKRTTARHINKALTDATAQKTTANTHANTILQVARELSKAAIDLMRFSIAA